MPKRSCGLTGNTGVSTVAHGVSTVPNSKRKKVGTGKKLRGKYDGVMSGLKAPNFDRWKALLSSPTLPKVVVGVDMSLTNPGLTVLDRVQKTVTMYFFRNRKRETAFSQITIDCHESLFHEWTFFTRMLELPEEKGDSVCSLYRFDKYQPKITRIVEIISSLDLSKGVVGIEGYSFYSKATQADTALKELGGILRWEVSRHKVDMIEIPPSVNKLLFSTKGHATKYEMYQAFKTLFQGPDLYDMLNIHFNPKAKLKNLPPHPIEDLVDSFSIALSTLVLISAVVD